MSPKARSRSPTGNRNDPARRTPADGTAAEFQDILYETHAHIARITIRRPESLNAYTTHTLGELGRALREATGDDGVGVIVLTGTGTRAFCSGGDVKEYARRYTRRPRDYWQYMGAFRDVVEGLLECGKPTIARLNGITVGGGNELHLACDLSVAASHIYLGQVGVGVGSVAAGGATQWLPLAVGDRRARQMLFLNERVPAARALEWGLVSSTVPSVRKGSVFLETPTAEETTAALRDADGYSIDLSRLDEAVNDLASRLLGMFPECLRYTKQQVNFWKELAWHSTIGHARDWLTLHFATREPHEGMNAFVEKRPAAVRALREEIATGRSAEYFGGPPVRSCASCGSKNLPEEFRFCGVCGAPLGAPPELGR